MIQRLLSTTLFGFLLIGFAKGQVTTGQTFEEAKTEIIKIEEEKVPFLLKGGSAAAGWYDRYDADDMAQTNSDGSTSTKAQHMAEYRSGRFKVLSDKEGDYHVRVYQNGNTVVVTYHGTSTTDHDGKLSTHQNQATDVWVKQGGDWQRVVHHVTNLRTQ